MKRILHIVSIMDRAGQETLIMNLYRNINREKIQFDFLCTWNRKGDYDDEIISLGGTIHHLPQNTTNLKFIKYFSNFFIIRKYLSQLSYDTIHIHNYHAFSSLTWVWAEKCAGIKNIILHSHNTSAPHKSLHKICRPLLKLFKIRRLACSKDASEWMFGTRDAKIILNGIVPETFKFDQSSRESIRIQLGLGNSTVITHVGRFNFQKNHIFLIEIFNEYLRINPNSKLLLIGKGELENEIRDQINTLGISDKVLFLGIREDIPAILSASDLFLFPSLFEGLSVVLVEAQATGIPIMTNQNLAEETLFADNALGLSIDDSPSSWAQKINKTICSGRNKDALKNIVEHGFDISITATEMQNYYLSL